MIFFETDSIEEPKIDTLTINRWIRTIIKGENKVTGQIRYVFCNDERILEINKEFLDHDYYTDIITFDWSESEIVSGEIFISLDTVKSNSVEFNTDYEQELHRVIIHGILHLCGQDDKTPETQLQMTTKEDKALVLLNNILNN